MSGNANFPTALDNDASLYDVTDAVSTLIAAHHNNLKEAIKAIESKVGINDTSDANSIDFRLATHAHDGASGMGAPLVQSFLEGALPASAYPSGGLIQDHFMHEGLHNARHVVQMFISGSLASTTNAGAPISFGRTMQLEVLHANLRRGPSGATTALDLNIGPTSMWYASQGLRPIFPPGATLYVATEANIVTYPSGAILTVDVDTVGANDPGRDLSLNFIFREYS